MIKPFYHLLLLFTIGFPFGLTKDNLYVCIANRCPTTMWFMPQSDSQFEITINIRPKDNDKVAFVSEADDVFSEDEMKKDDINQTRLDCEPQNIPFMDFNDNSAYKAMTIFLRFFVVMMFAGLFTYSWMVLKNYEECVCLKNATSGGNVTGTSAGQMLLHC
ncbi:Hypothetical protein CINCED_3A019902 [Cinara cedri]|uniref:Uncharacterized protein n=1 Tax=Cinara cedri TaxID=506608 RepID=A0A5E4N530_9HEMI|nr:Hypothetical protein CINCED_3A019902 [Cinara cedri]